MILLTLLNFRIALKFPLVFILLSRASINCYWILTYYSKSEFLVASNITFSTICYSPTRHLNKFLSLSWTQSEKCLLQMRSKIPFIQNCTWMNKCWITGYSRPKFLQVIFCYCSCTWAIQLSREFFYLYISICWASVIRVLYCIFWSLHSWRIWWGRRQGSWDTTTVDVQILLQAFWKMSLEIRFTKEAFFCYEANFWSWDSLLKCQNIRISELSVVGLKKFCCILFNLISTALQVCCHFHGGFICFSYLPTVSV